MFITREYKRVYMYVYMHCILIIFFNYWLKLL